MGLFDKKYCDVCGEKIGLLGNRKLEDGNLCKECAKKLSPWFDERRHSTVADIKGQLDYRESNRGSVAAFRTTRSFGRGTMIYLDEDNRKFMVCKTKNMNEENPDVIDFSMVTGCDLDIDEDRDEEKQEIKNSDGTTREVSYNPPRYTYDYDFWMRIRVNHPYFNEIKFKLNNNRVHYDPARFAGGMNRMNQGRVPQGQQSNANLVGSILTGLNAAVNQAANGGININTNSQPMDPRMQIPDYAEFYNMGQEIKAALMQIHTQVREDIAAANAPAQAMQCPLCGATTTPDASGRCEFCGGAIR